MHQRGRKLWRIKVLTLKGMATGYRVIHAFDRLKQVFYVLGIQPREIAYDQTHSRIQRLLAVYDSLGIA
jgi:mRNA-degrading endonuclease RelE of RelBE toxin-antitoxin system